jgi:2-polyprenyl-3-methyl-5-hydroxy-6-metoxy-1,4-benzoquinol methylase
MRFDELTRLVGKRIFLRHLVFILVRMTTLREWYLCSVLKKELNKGPQNFSFLDAGCGMGQFAFRIAKKYPSANVTGFEQMIQRVQDNNHVAARMGLKNLEFYSRDISQLTEKNRYHFILCNSVLEHIKDDIKTLEKLYDALYEKGILIIYVPSQEKRVLKALKKIQDRQLLESKTGKLHDHIRYYSKEELVSKAVSVGFECLQSTSTYGRFGRWSYDLVTLVQYHRYVRWLFPLYLIFLHPIVMILMWLDFIQYNKEGNGLMLVCQK